MARVLHVLAQRPHLTGSGVTLDALVARAARAGWEQAVVCAIPDGEPMPAVGDLPPERISPLRFESARLPFAIPGMSDVMPYPSRRWSSLGPAELDAYLAAWRDHMAAAIEAFSPELIHVHHVWLVAAGLAEWASGIPVVVHCHGTGLRQAALCPHLARRVRAGNRHHQRFAVLHRQQGEELRAALGLEPERVVVVGAGYRDDLFHCRGRVAASTDVVYAGKLCVAKGVPWLLDAAEALAHRRGFRLHLAGSGTGAEADRVRARAGELAPLTRLHGQLDQAGLAELLRSAAVFVLPSMFEGLPLVLIEAAACGCRLVVTALPGVAEVAPALGDLIELVPMPRLRGVDRPDPADQPALVADLEAALDRALARGPVTPGELRERLSPFTWDAVFERVASLWADLVPGAVPDRATPGR